MSEEKQGKKKKAPLFSARAKKWGCAITFLVWLLGTIILTVANWSVLPLAANAFEMSGPLVTLALIANAVVMFIISGAIIGVGMAMLGVFGFVLLILWVFFTGPGDDGAEEPDAREEETA